MLHSLFLIVLDKGYTLLESKTAYSDTYKFKSAIIELLAVYITSIPVKITMG